MSGQITFPYNGLRPGDEIIKQQVQYKDPGRNGANVLWDFGQLKSVNDQYMLDYTLPAMEGDSIYIMGEERFPVKGMQPGSLIVGHEHNTMYYYRYTGNSLELIGHENPVVQLVYTPSLLQMAYPLNYGQSVNVDYSSDGLYSGNIPVPSKGSVTVNADAYGRMILPSGDTLGHVMRIKTLQVIEDIPTEYTDEGKNSTKVLESCKWYSKGYRYPVFETLRDIDLRDSTEIFSTAFYFPPQDHFYLDDDPANLAVLDSLWNIEHRVDDITDPDNTNPKQQLTYNFYPNPVESYLTVEYFLEEASAVTLSLFSLEGRQVKTLTRPAQSQGLYREQLDCSGLTKGTYILKIQTNYTTISDKVIKK